MPRVNREHQRRMAARRERERRRPPAERRYRFGTPEAAVEPDEALTNGEDAVGKTVEDTTESPVRRSRQSRATGLTAAPAAASPAGHATHRPFSEYKAEYAYVLGDLRRVALVIGSLLLILILLYFVLPR